MGSKSRKFGEVFTRAQEILRKTFGMELVELQTRVEEKDDEQKKDLEKLGIKKKTASTNTKTFILRSVLHPSLIEIAASPDDDILRVDQADHTEDDVGDEVGVLYVILALILVNGKTISDSELRSLLKRMRLPGAANVPQNNQSPLQMFTFDAFLTICIRQGYLDRQRVGEVKGAGKKRGRAAVGTQAGGDDNANAWEWRWGSRAMSEVGEVDIARFVTDFMVERERAETGGEDEEDEDEDERQEAEKRREQVMKGVERAASGSLAGITGS
ncbi:hypothetical protein EW026_g5671 [Hermanssonia centrifuga]|uniref:MAGE domain-containing protein n=1 Tax=Hermanssonia centrifuga TaxID=98765 RepID=A0A4S4KHT7_9APHY|nr:hypothetical protein EW026_g5671 [Hermanssonia centrifuga]